MSLKALLQVVREYSNNHNPNRYTTLWCGGSQFGYVRKEVAQRVLRSSVFITSENTGVLELSPKLTTFDARNEALAGLAAELREEGVVKNWRGELLPAFAEGCYGNEAHFHIERAACFTFGLAQFATDLCCYSRNEQGELFAWVGVRADDKATFPSLLDVTVGGGLPAGVHPRENLTKECYEEAGIDEELAARARATGCVGYMKDLETGLFWDNIMHYELQVPMDFVPKAVDKEVAGWKLLPVQEVAERIVDEALHPGSSLVWTDFLLRHGIIEPDLGPEYMKLARALQGA